MATNVLLTSTLYSKLVLMQLGDKLKVVRNMSKDFQDQFGKDPKIGQSYQVRKPQRFVGSDLTPSNLNANTEAIDNRYTTVNLNQIAHTSFVIDAWQKTISLNEAYNLAEPAARALAARINAAAAKYIALNTFNAVGTPGTAPSDMATYLAAEDKLIQLGMPENTKVTAIINRKMSSAFVNGSKALFNNQDILGKQQETGRVVNQLGYEFQMDQTIYNHTTGAGAGMTLAVNGANQHSSGGNNGTGTLNINGATVSTTVAKAGDVFTIANVYSVHPETRQATGDLQQFVLLSDATSDASGNVSLSFAPAISDASIDAQYQNVDSIPATAAAVKFWDGTSATASKVSTQGLLVAPDAFAFVSIPFVDSAPGMEVTHTVDPDTGIALNLTRYGNGSNLQTSTRLDVGYGFGVLYRELACRICA